MVQEPGQKCQNQQGRDLAKYHAVFFIINLPGWTGCPLSFTFMGHFLFRYVSEDLQRERFRKLDNNTLAKQIYKEQKLQKWPGLAIETASICSELGLEDCNLTHLDKVTIWKNPNRSITLKKLRKNFDFLQGKNANAFLKRSMVERSI